MYITIIVLALLPLNKADCIPWGIRVSYGQKYMNETGINKHDIYLAYNTHDRCDTSKLTFNLQQANCIIDQLSIQSKDTSNIYNTFIHICGIDLNESQKLQVYDYKISELQETKKVSIYPRNTLQQVKVLVLGDWGLINQKKQIYYSIFDCLDEQINNHQLAAIFFMGDLGYDLQDNDCAIYENFLKAIEKYTSVLPFIVTPGNHDVLSPNTKTLFQRSFIMPNNSLNRNNFYGIELGLAQFVSFDPFDLVYVDDLDIKQINKLTNKIEQQFNKSSKPWKIPISHYPIYCSYLYDKKCTQNKNTFYPITKMFDQHNIKLYISGHLHLYEREFPLKNKQTVRYTQRGTQYNSYYYLPQGTTYIIQGAAGNDYFVATDQCTYSSSDQLLQYSAVEVLNTGFGILSISSQHQLIYQHYSAKECKVSDRLKIGLQKELNWGIISLCVMVVLVIVVVIIGICFRKRLQLNKEQSRVRLTEQI